MSGVIEAILGIEAGSPLAEMLRHRQEIMRLSQASHDAVLAPRDPGGLSHGERAALAARMSRHNREEALAAHYLKRLASLDGGRMLEPLADHTRPAAGDRRLVAIARHVDLLTCNPRDATRADIDALKDAGLTEADIVRLAELAAFVNYQVRVIAGLRLLKGAA